MREAMACAIEEEAAVPWVQADKEDSPGNRRSLEEDRVHSLHHTALDMLDCHIASVHCHLHKASTVCFPCDSGSSDLVDP